MVEAKEGPLAPYRALDLTDEKGFFCGKLLADLGADVIHIERPGGDPSRRLGPFYKDVPHPERSLYWFAYNANKRGITLNLETADGREIFKRLVKSADFVLESFPPDYLAQRGLDYPQLREINPRIILTSITPFGREGPRRHYKASDLTIMAMSGFMYLLGDPERPPVRVTFPQSYLWAGAYAVLGTLVAHYHRELTGEGQHVDVSSQAATTWAAAYAPFFWDAVRVNPKREGHRMTGRSHKDPSATYPTVYQCRDGYIAFLLYSGRAGAVTNKAMVEWMDEHGMATPTLKEKDWERFDQFQATQQEYDEMVEPVSRFLRSFAKKDFYREAVKRRIMGYPVSTAKDIMEDPQLEARGFWMEVEHPQLGETITYPGAFARFSETQCNPGRRAPLIGEHNEEVYVQELGFSREDLIRLAEAGVI